MGVKSSGGAKLGGEAEINRVYLKYTATGQIVLSGSNQISMAGLRWVLKGGAPTRITLGGSAVCKLGTKSSGGAKLGGSAELNRRYHSYTGNGTIALSGTSQIGPRAFRTAANGGLRLGGTTDTRSINHKYMARGGLKLGSANIVSVVYNSVVCAGSTVPCLVLHPSQHIVCYPSNFYYGECNANNTKKCNPLDGAMLPPITRCRQKGYLPPRDRDKKRHRPVRR